jgi:Ca-activated chloride channel family protein
MMKKLLIVLCLIGISAVQAQTKTITGVVSDKDGGLPGVSVLIKGTTKGTDTDFDGKYSIETKEGEILVFSYLGYETVEKKVKKESSVINVTMKEGGEVLDEIVVTSYGRAYSSRRATASVSYVGNSGVSPGKRTKRKSVDKVLQGAATGLQVTNGTGSPGQGTKILIRGRGNLQAGKDPLYIVDGVPVSAKDFRKVKPKNVQTVSVLKDANATALYGSRGSQGVIVVTTKTGKGITISENESYKEIAENQFQVVQTSPLSTFSIDVDKASYSNIRRMINNGNEIKPNAVKIEEMINYFTYDYPQPKRKHPFSINTEVVKTPWNNKTKLVRIGLQGKTYKEENLPPSNLTFLIDVSGSMGSHNKLPLLKESFKLLVNKLRAQDRVSIVVYAGAAGVVLEPTAGNEKKKILEALDKLESGGSTAGGAGINLAYKLAQQNFMKKGNNRVILATDGDFNVGPSSDDAMEKLIEQKRKSGVFLSVLGFGYGNYKDSKLELLADKGNGNHSYIDSMQEARKVFSKEFGGTLYTIAKDVKIQIEFNPQNVAAYRLIGYENRLLNDEDFVNDTIDAGELGNGHTVTALYEILPTGIQSDGIPTPIDLKYTKSQRVNNYQDELFTVKFRYKKPSKNKSIEMVHVQKDKTEINPSADMNFAAAVALFGMQLRESKFHNNSQIKDVIALAEAGKGVDKEGYRSEFIRLVKTYKTDF